MILAIGHVWVPKDYTTLKVVVHLTSGFTVGNQALLPATIQPFQTLDDSSDSWDDAALLGLPLRGCWED